MMDTIILVPAAPNNKSLTHCGDPSSPTPRAPTWQPIADVVAQLLPAFAQRAIAYNIASGNIAEADAIRQTAQRAGVLPS